MKKGVIFCFLFVFIILTIFPSVSALLNATQEKQKVDMAYACLESKVKNVTCSSLTEEERIFVLLSTGQCKTEVLADSSNAGECWPSGNCRIKTTAQAILALDNVGASTSKAQSWLLNQTGGVTELSWFLEIESPNQTSCQIDYASFETFTIDIGSDKKIIGDTGSCLTITEDRYWLEVSPSCFDEEFSISCDKNFLTTLLFKKEGSSTVYVLPKSSSAVAEGTTIEKVNSTCFVQENVCNYEGSLWATLVLDSLDKEVSTFVPYITALKDDKREFLPESFLYFITSSQDYKNSLLSKQKVKKWWLESGNKLYDTALALYPFQKETIQEKTNSKEWLLSTQDANGCWENNVRNTGFILASIWPKTIRSSSSAGGGNGTTTLPGCESNGYYCTTSSICGSNNGDILSDYSCSALYKCCNVEPRQETCAEQGGDICPSSQVCRNGGTVISASGLDFGESCCVEGSCVASSLGGDGENPSTCEASGGTCRTSSCNSGEEESDFYSCGITGDTCCVPSLSSGRSYTWVWILLVLILVLVLALLFI